MTKKQAFLPLICNILPDLGQKVEKNDIIILSFLLLILNKFKYYD